jgi:type IV secretory pathway TrbL component
MKIDWNLDGFKEIRTSEGMNAVLREMGEETVTALNSELAQAQTARRQPVNDGYGYHVSTGGSRDRLQIVAYTARAQAHEAKHQSILRRIDGTSAETQRVRAGRREAAQRVRQGFDMRDPFGNDR